MAENNIDTLELELISDSNAAVTSLDKLSKKLIEVNRSVASLNAGNLRKFSKEIGNLTGALRIFSNLKIKMPEFQSATKEVDKFGKYVHDESVKMADSLMDAFDISDKKVRASIRDMAKEMGRLIQVGDPSYIKGYEEIGNAVSKAANSTKYMSEDAENFLDTVRKLSKIKINPGIPKAYPDEWKSLDGLLRQKVSTKEGISLDSKFAEWTDDHSPYKSMIEGFGNRHGFDFTNDEDQLLGLQALIRECREGIEVPLSAKGLAASDIWDETLKAVTDLHDNIKQTKKTLDNLGGAKAETPNMDFSKFISEISKASKIDLSGISEIGNSFSTLARSMETLQGLQVNATPVMQLINLIGIIGKSKNVTSAQNLKSISNDIGDFAKSIAPFANIPDISNSVNRIVGSIQRIASSGDKSSIATSQLPVLTKQLIDVVNKMSSLGDISQPVNTFIQSLAKIITAGSKSEQAGKGMKILASELNDLFKVMQKAPKIGDNTLRMVESLSKLSESGSKANRAADRMTKTFSNLSGMNNADRLFNNLHNSSSKASIGVGKLGGGFRSLLRYAAPFFGLYEAFSLGKKSIDIASGLTEVQNVVDVAFGSARGKMEELADVSIEDFGMSELTAKKIGSRYQAMGTAMGFTKEKMSEMSIGMTKLAADMASFYNVSQHDVARSLQAVFTGEQEPLILAA